MRAGMQACVGVGVHSCVTVLAFVCQIAIIICHVYRLH